MQFLADNWTSVALPLLVAADAIVSLTPSKTDDKIVGYLRLLVSAIAQDKKKDRK